MQQTIFITGASSGFGKLTAKLFAQRGWNVVASMKNPKKEKELRQFKNILILQVDVTKPRQIKAAIKQTMQKFGSIDVLLNNAGYGLFGFFDKYTQKEIEQEMQVNFYGVVNMTQNVLPVFFKQKKGMIINISSIAGRIALPLGTIYSASKFAVEGLTESLQYELAEKNISVKLIEPGNFKTNFEKNLKFDRDHTHKQVSAASKEYKLFAKNSLEHPPGKIPQGNPLTVAEKIWSVAHSKSSHLRYPVGTDAKLLVLTERLFGKRATYAVLNKIALPHVQEKHVFAISKKATWADMKGMHTGSFLKKKSLVGFFLQLSNWQGKEFITKKNVWALVHNYKHKLYKIKLGKASVHEEIYQSKKTVAMKYTYLPITDYFRKKDANTVMGAMTLFGVKKPIFYFYLRKKK